MHKTELKSGFMPKAFNSKKLNPSGFGVKGFNKNGVDANEAKSCGLYISNSAKQRKNFAESTRQPSETENAFAPIGSNKSTPCRKKRNRIGIKVLSVMVGAVIAVVTLAMSACSESALGQRTHGAKSATAQSAAAIAADENALSEKCLRLHIRANSDDSGDQSVKLKVRDEVNAMLSRVLVGAQSKGEAAAVIEGAIGDITAEAERTLEQNGYGYGARAYLSREWFPDREYGGRTFPSGYYDALIILLGSGEGANWWCVAFPPLCFTPSNDSGDVCYVSWFKQVWDSLWS